MRLCGVGKWDGGKGEGCYGCGLVEVRVRLWGVGKWDGGKGEGRGYVRLWVEVWGSWFLGGG